MQAEGNLVLEYGQYLVFGRTRGLTAVQPTLAIERPEKFGGIAKDTPKA